MRKHSFKWRERQAHGPPNGRALLPPMPWESLKGLTDEDLKAIWAYLKSLPPEKSSAAAGFAGGNSSQVS